MSAICFIGAGKMATAIAGGAVKSGLYKAKELLAYDISAEAAKAFTGATGVRCVTGNPAAAVKEAVKKAAAVLLAVKPQQFAAAAEELKGALDGKTVISIIAGMPLAKLQEATGAERIIRVMPNTPALVKCGAAAYAPAEKAEKADCELTEKIFGAVGTVIRVNEKDLDAVTALSGSGPAYVFLFIQALADGGVAAGLPRKAALELALQTVTGAAAMARNTGMHPAELKDMVTSPGGTTAAALRVLENRAFTGAVTDAVLAARDRSEELGK